MATAAGFGEPPPECVAGEVLNRIGDKWTVYAIAYLGRGTRRFSELQRSIEGISQRMLTVTLRALERDGLVTRTVYPQIPPRVEYTLTPLGYSLLDVVGELVQWSEAHIPDIAKSRTAYDKLHEG